MPARSRLAYLVSTILCAAGLAGAGLASLANEVVSCQNERSQTQNRENALKVLRARLAEIEERKRREQLAELKGAHVSAEWGSQIRSYVLHPYQMVKDHRTEHETGNTSAVLDGQLDAFMEAYLRMAVGQEAA